MATEIDEKTIIRSLSSPTIPIDKMEIDDVDTKTSPKYNPSQQGTESSQQMQNLIGVDFPFIILNTYIFTSDEIRYFEIDATSFIPQLTFIFKLTKSDVFSSQSFPKDGDVVSIFIKAKNDAFKPVRNDYIILSIDAGNGGAENLGRTITITGELHIPRIKDQIVKSITGTSFVALQEISKTLGLGFATNETETVDTQVWMCAGDSWKEYILKVAKHSWKNTNSFYKVYIDIYYHLNFINVNNQMIGKEIIISQLIDQPGYGGFSAGDKDLPKETQTKTVKLLTNLQTFKSTNMFVRGYSTVNNSNSVHENWGYKYSIQFYDLKSRKYWDIFIDPIVSNLAEKGTVLLKGRILPLTEAEKSDKKNNDSIKESSNPITKLQEMAKGVTGNKDYWKTQNKYVWKGIQSKNVHDKWIYSEVYNARNLQELEKMYINVDINRWNPNIYMGEKIPVLFFSDIDLIKNKEDASVEDDQLMGEDLNRSPVIDKFNSGFYMVNGLRIIYESSNSAANEANGNNSTNPQMREVITLTRREWPIP